MALTISCMAGQRPSAPHHTRQPRAAAAGTSQRRLVVSAVAAPISETDAIATSSNDLAEARQWLEAAAAAPAGTPSGGSSTKAAGRVILESEDELKSTWEHRAWVGGATALMGATLLQGLAAVDGPGEVAAAGAAALAAYYLADVGTAFYHWCAFLPGWLRCTWWLGLLMWHSRVSVAAAITTTAAPYALAGGDWVRGETATTHPHPHSKLTHHPLAACAPFLPHRPFCHPAIMCVQGRRQLRRW